MIRSLFAVLLNALASTPPRPGHPAAITYFTTQKDDPRATLNRRGPDRRSNSDAIKYA